MGKRPTVPAKIDFLDLFCGDGTRMLQLANAHPDKVFVGVDKADLPKKVRETLPANVRFVRSDVREFLRTRRYGNVVRHVNVDFGLGAIDPNKRREVYRAVHQLLVENGRVHVSTTSRLADQFKEEMHGNGFRLVARRPLVTRSPVSSQSTFGQGYAQYDSDFEIPYFSRLTFKKHAP